MPLQQLLYAFILHHHNKHGVVSLILTKRESLILFRKRRNVFVSVELWTLNDSAAVNDLNSTLDENPLIEFHLALFCTCYIFANVPDKEKSVRLGCGRRDSALL